MITFQKGTKLVIDNGVNRYQLLVGSATASQTYVESSQKVKTIHNPNIVERTFVNEKGTSNLTFSCYVGDGITESSIFEWFGFSESTGTYVIDPNINTLQTVDIYIDAGNTIYKLDTCVGQNISFKLSRKEALMLEVTGVASDLITVSSIPSITYAQDSSKFYNDTIDITNFSNIAEVTCEITRTINWLGQKSVHDTLSGNIYKQKNPVLASMAISGSITQNKVDNTNVYNNSTPVQIKYGSTFEINLTACNTTDRWDMSSIHQKTTDYKLLPTAVSSYIKF
jgi:hypothetical protein|tara:strand:+ start:8835 stop:9680 length:846 start_codon:yes stop_codon:yes gene_type:complete